MPEKHKSTLPAPPKTGLKHGLYSWVSSKKIPQGRAFQKIRAELSKMRGELIDAHGGEDITPDAAIMVDSAIEALGVQKLLGLYVRKYGVIDGQAAKRGRLELSPILSRNWIGYANVTRQAILALKELDAQQRPANVPTIADIIAEHDEAEAQAGQDAPENGLERAKEGRTTDPLVEDNGQ